MRAFILAAALAAGLILPSAASAQPVPPTMDEQGLRWERAPSISRMARLYPRRARLDGHTRGLARLACTPDASGRLDCRPFEEDPDGYGFGQAAMQVMDRATVASLDGGSPEGRAFLFTLRFGNWPPSLLSDRFHPSEAGLRWTIRPEMNRWDGVGQARGETYAAVFDCVARADGSLDCELLGTEPAGIDRYAAAAREAMAAARVRAEHGGSPEGVRFRWTVGNTRMNN